MFYFKTLRESVFSDVETVSGQRYTKNVRPAGDLDDQINLWQQSNPNFEIVETSMSKNVARVNLEGSILKYKDVTVQNCMIKYKINE